MALVKCLSRVNLGANEILFHQGEEVKDIFLLAQGCINLFERMEDGPDAAPTMVDDFGSMVADDSISESWLSASSPTSQSRKNLYHRSTAVASVESTLFRLSKKDIFHHIQKNPIRILQEKMDLIECIPLFAKARAMLRKQELESIASSMLILEFPSLTTVASQGDEAQLTIIISGWWASVVCSAYA